jgi:hypothetical protein
MQNEINNKAQRTSKCEFNIWPEWHRDGEVRPIELNILENIIAATNIRNGLFSVNQL